eukprot:gene1448-2788_t
MAAQLERFIADYEYRLTKLRIWPDRNIIFDLTKFAEVNQKIANHIADILISRIIDVRCNTDTESIPLTNLALKVPLFYLVDSILKNVGGPYVSLFSSHIVEVYRRVFDELNEKDKARLDYMLSTWEQRRILPKDFLLAMRSHIGARIVCIPIPPPAQRFRSQDMSDDRYMDKRRGRGGMGQRRDFDDRGGGREPPHIFKQNVQKEMEFLLDKMYTEMGTGPADRILLDDLQKVNPQLYAQMKVTAEATVNERRDREALASGRGSGSNRSWDRSRDGTVRAFVGEMPVTVDISRAETLVARMRAMEGVGGSGSDKSTTMSYGRVSARLSSLLKDVHIPPLLPPILTGPMPASMTEDKTPGGVPVPVPEGVEKLPTEKKVTPPFRPDELNKNPSAALKTLYQDRRFYSRQDGLRFLTQNELGSHLDTLFVRNKGKQKKNERGCRSWYCTIPQWVSDFSALGQTPSQSSSKIPGMGPVAEGDDDDYEEELFVPADEQFTRCPVSHEAFIPVWDEEEGDFVFRNAVKVLVVEASDPGLFRVFKPTVSSPTIGPELRYGIVHKRLVLDRWISSGKVISLREYTKRCQAKGKADEELAKALAEAAGEDDDEDDNGVRDDVGDNERSSSYPLHNITDKNDDVMDDKEEEDEDFSIFFNNDSRPETDENDDDDMDDYLDYDPMDEGGMGDSTGATDSHYTNNNMGGELMKEEYHSDGQNIIEAKTSDDDAVEHTTPSIDISTDEIGRFNDLVVDPSIPLMNVNNNDDGDIIVMSLQVTDEVTNDDIVAKEEPETTVIPDAVEAVITNDDIIEFDNSKISETVVSIVADIEGKDDDNTLI